AVSSARQRFDVSWRVCRLVQGRAQPLNRRVKTVFEVYKRICGPEVSLNFLTSDELAGTLHEHCEDGEWLAFQPNANPLFAKFPSARVKLVGSEAMDIRISCSDHHGKPPLSRSIRGLESRR